MVVSETGVVCMVENIYEVVSWCSEKMNLEKREVYKAFSIDEELDTLDEQAFLC